MPDDKYFSNETVIFLNELRDNNNKAWFEERRDIYERKLLNPMKNLVGNMSDAMLDIDPLFETRPMINKTISRIYRDIRFSKNKEPLRPNMWISFKRPSKDWKIHPGYFFEIMPMGFRFGLGFYNAEKVTMDTLRQKIKDGSKRFREVYKLVDEQDVFTMYGDEYKRIATTGVQDKYLEWYKKKNVFFMCNREIDGVLLGDGLSDYLCSSFSLLAPVYHFLSELCTTQPKAL